MQLRKINSPAGRLLAVGDLHGSGSELTVLLNYLEGDFNLSHEDLLVFIGDYVDRGPESRQVIDILLSLKRKFPHTVFLKGNHEDMLLSFLGYEGSNGEFYLQNGGTHTMLSYGLEPDANADQVRKHIPIAHQDFFRGLELGVEVEDFVFVHAGLAPLKTIEEQTADDVLWIRDEFIQNIHKFDKTVVFGHTPYWQVLLHRPYKIGIDTGCAYGNLLTCIDLTNQVTMQIKKGETEVKVTSLEALPSAEG